MPNPAIDLTDLTSVKEHIGIDLGDTTQDSRLDKMITRASRRIMSWCDRRFIEESYTEFKNGRRSNSILLRHFPASKPTELYIDSSSVFGASTLVDSSEYDILDGSLVVLLEGRNFEKGRRNIKVVYTAGYTFASLPEDLVDNANMLVEFMYQMVEERRIGLVNKGKSGETTTYVQGIPQFIKEGLEPYKRPYEWGSDVAIENS